MIDVTELNQVLEDLFKVLLKSSLLQCKEVEFYKNNIISDVLYVHFYNVNQRIHKFGLFLGRHTQVSVASHC